MVAFGKMHPKTETFLDRTLTEIIKRRDPVVSSVLNSIDILEYPAVFKSA